VVITEVRIKLMDDNNENERLQAFCSVTFDDAFVVRDLKIIEGTKGSFVAMPSRKLTDRCPGCGSKNHLRARFCNQCGGKLDEDRATRDADGRVKLHADIAHPINSACREVIQTAVLRAFQAEKERSKQPGYVCTYDDFDSDYDAPLSQVVSELNAVPPRGYRTPAPHTHRAAHAAGQDAAREEKRSEGFGAGIL
jgi:stage V sporulation protein G